LLLKNKNTKTSDSSKLIQDQIFNLSKVFDEKLSQNNTIINNNLNQNLKTNSDISKTSNKLIEDITIKLASLEETNKQIKDIWWQLEWFESILKNPKQRWILWEYFLESVLKNILPPDNYKLQYKFKSGEIVDAVIFIDKKIVPIDSKFSLENYNKILDSKTDLEKQKYEAEFRKDLKKRIDETSKYIKPQEGTMEFAFMFIPSEWIYYDLLVNKIGTLEVNTIDLVEYAFKEKKVIIVSPTSFYAYLQTVMQGLRALQIENQAEEIKKQIWNLWRHLWAYEEYFTKLWSSLNTTLNHYTNAWKEFKKIDKDIFKITWSKTLKIEE
jgi:DNA recombination protein RmuC